MDQQGLDQGNKEEKRELATGVVLYKKFEQVEDNPEIVGLFTWKLEISVLNCVDFEVDLDQSENIELKILTAWILSKMILIIRIGLNTLLDCFKKHLISMK